MKMSGISLSENDKWLIGLSVLLPPLAVYLKFGRSKTLATNCLLTALLLVPGVVHAMRSIHSYPSVVFRGKREPKDKFAARDGSVIWEMPRGHFQSISQSVHVREAHDIALKSNPVRVKSITGLSLASGIKAQPLPASTLGPGDSYMAHVHGQAPILNPGYGWGPLAQSRPPMTSAAVH
ncbi:hypothetical protein GGI07_003531 [Coemansia sp. Benny D115]|nr:hypothetical protein GGI07_003531 [Coemansia sp. Benny D115]